MVLEQAVITIRPGTGREFEYALSEARGVVAGAAGFVSIEACRGIERPDEYVLLIRWRTLEDHVEGFRGSEAFGRWRALIGPFFASPPVVTHLATVLGDGGAP